MNDTQKFAEHLNNQVWDQGVSDDKLKAVVSFFAPGEEKPSAPGQKVSVASSPAIKHGVLASSRQATPSPGEVLIFN